MHRTIRKTILVATVIAVCALSFSGCKKEHTIDKPYDFRQGTSGSTGGSENEGDENGSLVDDNTTVPSGSSHGDSDGNASSGNSSGGSDGNASSGGSNGSSNGTSSGGSNGGSNGQSSSDSSNGGSSNGGASSNNSASQGNSGTSGSPSGGTGNLTFMDVAEDYQVPKDVEDKMTTKALLDTYMSYPFFDTICFETSPEDTYNQWIDSDISCGKELMSRKDIVSVALNCYQELLASEPTNHIASESEVVVELKLDWIELLLHHSTVQNKASKEEKAEVLKLAQLRDSTVEKNGYAITELLPDLATAYK